MRKIKYSEDPHRLTLKKENDISNDKGEDNSYIMECPPTARDSVISLKNVECDKNVDSTNNTNRKTYMDLPTSHAVGEETINLKKNGQQIIIKSMKKALKRKADETPASLYPTKKH